MMFCDSKNLRFAKAILDVSFETFGVKIHIKKMSVCVCMRVCVHDLLFSVVLIFLFCSNFRVFIVFS